MQKILIAFLLLTGSLFATAQTGNFNIPDYKNIEKETTTKSSALYYPKLLARYNNFDTTLTQSEFQYLYYGALYNPSHNVFGSADLKAIRKRLLSQKQLEDKQLDTLLQVEKKIVAGDPFSMRDLNIIENLYLRKGYKDSASLIDFQLTGIIKTIFATGDGKTQKTGFHITVISHEYDILNVLGFKPNGQSLVGNCDVLHVDENDKGVKDVYFDATKILEAEMNMFKKK